MRLIHGEWVLVSMAMRIGLKPENRFSKAEWLVGMRPSSITSPLSVSSRQRWL
jgi:hypothetical protein